MDRRDVEAQVWESYRRHVGKVIEVDDLDGWRQIHAFTVVPERPFLVRIEPTTADDIIRWHDDWLDPHWNVKPVEDYPELNGMDGFWVFGESFCLSGEKGEPSWRLSEPSTQTITDTESQLDLASATISTLRSVFSRAARALASKVHRSR